MQSTNSLKNQHNINEKQAAIENSFKQFSSERRKLKSELKAEQQKYITLQNKFITFKYL